MRHELQELLGDDLLNALPVAESHAQRQSVGDERPLRMRLRLLQHIRPRHPRPYIREVGKVEREPIEKTLRALQVHSRIQPMEQRVHGRSQQRRHEIGLRFEQIDEYRSIVNRAHVWRWQREQILEERLDEQILSSLPGLVRQRQRQ